MEANDLVKQYLRDKHLMQLATTDNKGLWCCTVYFVHLNDELIWTSLPTRRHSLALRANPAVAAAIVVQGDLGQKVIGLQASGEAAELTEPKEIRSAASAYAKRFDRTQQWVDSIAQGQTDHRMYRLRPERLVLFDEEHFSGDKAQQEIKM